MTCDIVNIVAACDLDTMTVEELRIFARGASARCAAQVHELHDLHNELRTARLSLQLAQESATTFREERLQLQAQLSAVQEAQRTAERALAFALRELHHERDVSQRELRELVAHIECLSDYVAPVRGWRAWLGWK